MCTVTITYKGNNDFVLTSNRDEAPNRISLTPGFYDINGVNALYPKDELSGGTWIGVSEQNRLVCVLNGGFEIHERKAEYRKSRGVVVKDFLVMKSINDAHQYKYVGIEPFTMIVADWNTSLNFYEIVWDGKEAHFYQLGLKTIIRSSSTLYNEKMKIERLQWFNDFKLNHVLNAESLLRFHKEAGDGNSNYGVVMDRGFVKTTSITQIDKIGDAVHMRYENLQNGTIANQMLSLPQIVNE